MRAVSLITRGLHQSKPRITTRRSGISTTHILFSMVQTFRPVVNRTHFTKAICNLMHLLPPNITRTHSKHVFSSQVRVTTSSLQRTINVLHTLPSSRLRLLTPHVIQLIIRISIRRTRLHATLPITRTRPITITNTRHIPQATTHNGQNFQRPMTTQQSRLMTLFTRRGRILTSGIVALNVKIRLQAYRAMDSVVQRFLLRVIVQVMGRLLRTSRVKSMRTSHLRTNITTILPTTSYNLIFKRSHSTSITNRSTNHQLSQHQAHHDYKSHHGTNHGATYRARRGALLRQFGSWDGHYDKQGPTHRELAQFGRCLAGGPCRQECTPI